MNMDYNRFVERMRKMYPQDRQESFDIEAKEQRKKDDNADVQKTTPNVQEPPNTGENYANQ